MLRNSVSLLIFLAICFCSTGLWGNTDRHKAIFSHEGGFYTEPFTLTISVPESEYDLLYTIDGSNPQTSASAINGGKSKTLTINPTSTSGRPKTPCYLVRVSLRKQGEQALLPITHTYIFLSEVITQKHPGGKWPTNNVNGQLIDLEMDSKVTQDPLYRNKMIDALKDIPSISVVTDIESLFDSKTGIYVNAWGHGPDWERFCSVELIDPKLTKGFNVNAGLRIRGGWSRHNDYPKHAFRLFFREEYGDAKLNFPLFEDEGVDQFDKIDLRCEQNYAWSNGQKRNTLVREVFSRDSQRDMGQPYTRSRYYHLYLNGMYWGIFQTQERSEARFGESYFEGDKEDFDVVKVNTDHYQYDIEATDGNLDAWKKIWDLCQKGFKNNRDYFLLEGKDENGVPIKGNEKLLDIDNLIDYMVTIFYTGNFDSPVSSFRGNRDPNNLYAMLNRSDKTQGFIFFSHDAEHSLMYEGVSPGKGLYENRVQLQGMHVDNFSKFHPQWLHHKLAENAEYRQRFFDRAYLHLYNDGVFTPHKSTERFMKRAKQIELAVIAESARWGDSKRGSNPYTKDNDWLPEVNAVVNNFFPYRTSIVIDQLVDAGLYKNIEQVRISSSNKVIKTDKYVFYHTVDVVLNAATQGVEIYYTTDGSDPREVGGGVSKTASKAENGETLGFNGTTVVTARAKQGSNWSALNTIRFIKNYEDYYNLQVTELHYWPADSLIGSDTISEKQFEFIEYKNTGIHAVDLSRLKFHAAIDFKFDQKAIVYPNQFYVIASSSKWFFERYGVAPSAVYKKAFSNTGEVVAILADDGRVVLPFAYSPQNTWYVQTAGTGHSMVSRHVFPVDDPKDDVYWRVSTHYHGSPFADDTGFPLAINTTARSGNGLKVYPNPCADLLYIENDEDSVIDVAIYSSTGQLVYSEKAIGFNPIDLRQINRKPGMFMVRIIEGGKPSVHKIMYRP